ncbi:hypothetical protein [Bacteroides faecichinchillae]|uniref:hypothetical protein n=1 Tax=Bacteroides faecichinchillae TaxID=871325 RepID=UPI0010A5A9EB|nr:hypothetical protein [Bacteroides faecichinchillae]THG53113.1 hypothetical protein E5981_19145 [Bacteroides faecichinchillae]
MQARLHGVRLAGSVGTGTGWKSTYRKCEKVELLRVRQPKPGSRERGGHYFGRLYTPAAATGGMEAGEVFAGRYENAVAIHGIRQLSGDGNRNGPSLHCRQRIQRKSSSECHRNDHL